MLRRLVIVVALLLLPALAIQCSGSSGSPPADPLSYEIGITLVQDTGRAKLATIPEDQPLVIFSDQFDREDPRECTHARARLLDVLGGRVVAEILHPLKRSATPPYPLETSSRRFTLISTEAGENLSLIVQLGRNFGSKAARQSRREVVYYSGVRSKLALRGQKVLLDGTPITSLKVPIGLNVDTSSETIPVQGYIDYRGIPNVPKGLPLQDPPNLPSAAVYAAGPGKEAYQIISTTLASEDQPLSQFFEASEVTTSAPALVVVVQSGLPFNYVLSCYVTPAEMFSGKPVLIDWETTFVTAVAQYLSETEIPGLGPALYKVNSARAQKLLEFCEKKIAEPLAAGGNAITVGPEETVGLSVYFQFASFARTGDPLGILYSTSKIRTRVIDTLDQKSYLGINYFFLSKGRNLLLKNGSAEYFYPSGTAIILPDANYSAFIRGSDNAAGFTRFINSLSP